MQYIQGKQAGSRIGSHAAKL